MRIEKILLSGNMNITILGCGKMGSAFVGHLSKKGALLLCSRNANSLDEIAKPYGAKTSSSLEKSYEFGDVILLGVKPKDLEEVSLKLSKIPQKPKVILSMLAGVNLKQLEKSFPNDHIVRIMPNLPIKISRGVIACSPSDKINDEVKRFTTDLLEDFGRIVWGDEKLLDSITVIAGSGPAFVSYFIDAMIEAGTKLGLSEDLSKELVFETFYGTLKLLESEGKKPEQLMKEVASPGGCTMVGLKVKESHKVKASIIEAILKAHEKVSST